MVGPGLGRYTPGAILFRQACQLLLPRRCPLCGRVLGGVPDCPDCALEWKIRTRWPGPGPYAPPPALGGGIVAWAAAPFWYAGGIRDAVHRAKYGGQPWTAVQLGCALAGRLFGAEVRVRAGVEVPVPLAAPPVDCDLIVPVPSSGRGRSCNVPALMGLPLAHALGIPLDETALRRTRKGRAQAGLTREERLVNAAGLFRADPGRAAGRRVLLVDDVITTGATAAACARALTAAGAEWVAVAGLAASRQDHTLPARPGQPFDLDDAPGEAEDFI